MKKSLLLFSLLISLTSCHQSIEERAEKEAKEYTEKYCPTPVNNFTKTDSVVFYKDTKTYHYYCSFTDKMDDEAIVNSNRQKINDDLLMAIKESTALKQYKEANFTFAYTCRSAQNPKKVLFKGVYTPKQYQ